MQSEAFIQLKNSFNIQALQRYFAYVQIDSKVHAVIPWQIDISMYMYTYSLFCNGNSINRNMHFVWIYFCAQQHRNLSNEIRKFYFGDGAIDEQTIPQYFELLSDMNFALGVDKSVRTLAANSKGKTYYTW